VTQPNIAPPRTATLEIGGHDVVLAYADERAEYAALQTHAIVIDRSHRGRLRIFGEKSGEALTGLVTNDVMAIAAGHGQYAAALTSKGRILADVRIFAGTASYLVDASARAWPGFFGMVKKYVNPRTTGYRDDSFAVRDIGIFGARSAEIVSACTGVSLETLGALPSYGHVEVTVDDASVMIANVPDIGVMGYELFVPYEMFDRMWERAVETGATPAGLGAWEIARVEAGRAEWGIDIDDSTIPQEANFDDIDAISYTKGCYIGQEVVARVHFRGHVNRHLRGLRAASTDAPPHGAQLIDDSGNHVGDVRSSVASPRFGGIAIGMVRREVTPGTSLNAKWENGERRVDVTLLPFLG
jgi:folate-binding protein YgfZ